VCSITRADALFNKNGAFWRSAQFGPKGARRFVFPSEKANPAQKNKSSKRKAVPSAQNLAKGAAFLLQNFI
jgi:type IV secretory pathway VirB9-like protein